MSRSDGAPEVFGDGDMTVAVNKASVRLYVGTVQVEYVERLSLGQSESGAELSVQFFRSHDPEVSRKIEEHVRLARTVPWIRVTQ